MRSEIRPEAILRQSGQDLVIPFSWRMGMVNIDIGMSDGVEQARAFNEMKYGTIIHWTISIRIQSVDIEIRALE